MEQHEVLSRIRHRTIFSGIQKKPSWWQKTVLVTDRWDKWNWIPAVNHSGRHQLQRVGAPGLQPQFTSPRMWNTFISLKANNLVGSTDQAVLETKLSCRLAFQMDVGRGKGGLWTCLICSLHLVRYSRQCNSLLTLFCRQRQAVHQVAALRPLNNADVANTPFWGRRFNAMLPDPTFYRVSKPILAQTALYLQVTLLFTCFWTTLANNWLSHIYPRTRTKKRILRCLEVRFTKVRLIKVRITKQRA